METLMAEPQWLTPLDSGTLYVCKALGHGFVVLNRHEQWTPILNSAGAFPAAYARALVARLAHEGAFTRERLEIL
jgi:hypothetical protein